jgi:hypothetical protein
VNRVLVFDTSIATKNLGDIIICDAVYDHLKEIFDDSHFMNTATHDYVGRETYKLNRKCNQSFVAGSNLLSSNMNSYNQWKINIIDGIFLRNITLVGVGWWQYQNKPNIYTKYLLKTILSNEIIHSVRDDYTAKQLRSIGIDNVINTGCPTTWKLTESHCLNIKSTKSDRVVFTLTDYNKDTVSDRFFVDQLINNYESVHFWPQGEGDLNYLRQLIDIKNIVILSPSVSAFNEVLANGDIDYIGTRLHAGIRALQFGRRSLILAVDNRAIEMQKDINLPVALRKSHQEVVSFITDKFETLIRIKSEEIIKWKGQFNK